MGLQLEYKEDDIILKEKASNHHMYLILEGSVALYSNYGTPDEYLYGILGKGRTFGEIGLLTHEDSIYSAVAVSNVKVATFSENELDHFIEKYPDYAIGVMRSIAKMNQIFRANLKMVTEEFKDYAKYRTLYEDVIKLSTDPDSEESEEAKRRGKNEGN